METDQNLAQLKKPLRFSLLLDEIRWKLDESFPAMDADELVEFDDVALADVQNPLAVPLVAVLKSNRRLQSRIRAIVATLKTAITVIHQQHGRIHTLERQNHILLAERRKA